MTDRTVAHTTFTIERSYPVAAERVYQAFADPVAKLRWFAGPAEWQETQREMDFRVGGKERVAGGPVGGDIHAFDCTYLDILAGKRIIYSYDMYVGKAKISVSLVTVEFAQIGKSTRVTFTEHAAFLDGFDDAGSREQGTRWLLDKVGASLEKAAA